MTKLIKVVIVDDHPIVRRGVKLMLERAEDIELVGEASTGEEALRLVKETSPDVLILDMQLPDMDGVEVTQTLQQNGSAVKILILSAHDDLIYIHELMEAGAMGYLIKDEAQEMIVDAVRGISKGEEGWLSRSIAAQMVAWVRGDDDGTVKFTPREREILQVLVQGKTNQQIASGLSISEKTVEKHLSSIFQKYGVSSRTEAAVSAVREGINKSSFALKNTGQSKHEE